MSEKIIEIENLSKLYRLGDIGTGSLKNDVQRWWAKLRGKEDPFMKVGAENDRSKKGQSDYVWSLKDISFSINKGDALGIIGKNGAGKSTLLKLLSRVTAPTQGQIKIKGRVASLLEVGTGFHPDLTGLENIFLNGAIMGMTKSEIKAKLEEIVEFSGIAAYIDTPIKRYSTGMRVRLGFAVAAHLDSEILIVDEVLAVGDSVFQKKCIDKMTKVRSEGRTILFVSHQLSAVKSLCKTGVVLENGKLRFQGDIDGALAYYATTNNSIKGQELKLGDLDRHQSVGQIKFERIVFENYPVNFGETIKFKLILQTQDHETLFSDIDMAVNINDRNKSCIVHCANKFLGKNFSHTDDQMEYHFEIENNLKPGYYYMTLFLRSKDVIQDWIEDQIILEIQGSNPYGYHSNGLIQGNVLPGFNISQVNSKVLL
ncbi:ABC transporter ATP-binding protein [Fulvivirgaceae bacterium BMA12]|uniref:ABC transporter ATP-binding protein n=1 Tax=Agaribacillus aureus TaxID=3051825 RepID=A0ABT8L3T7_9BACT|nr:ABC transporter ATP-binding protein [Fulvivirgaceae bacterium BMA12]